MYTSMYMLVMAQMWLCKNIACNVCHRFRSETDKKSKEEYVSVPRSYKKVKRLMQDKVYMYRRWGIYKKMHFTFYDTYLHNMLWVNEYFLHPENQIKYVL